MCILAFIAASHMIIIRWKQATCLLTDGWINTMEYYSALKGTDAPTPVRIWTSLEDMTPCGVSQSLKDKCGIITPV